MRSLACFDDCYPVRTFFTDNADWQCNDGWRDPDTRLTVLQDWLHVPLKQVVYARETHSGSVYLASAEYGGSLEIMKENDIIGPTGGYDALVTAEPGVLLCIWTADRSFSPTTPLCCSTRGCLISSVVDL